MQFIQRCRTVFILKNTITQSATVTAAAATSHSASFHSTSALFDKWKNKFSEKIRVIVREKRRGAKRTLKGILNSEQCSTRKAELFSRLESDYTNQLRKKSRLKPAHHSKKVLDKKWKRKQQREKMFEDFDYDPTKTYYATFGKHGFRTSGMGFDTTENCGWSNSRFHEQDAKSGIESHPFFLGTYADRKTLGLPTTGPLIIEDVKTAFRLSALKWHPDRHQGSSQAAAEEKFKQCVDAYKSLCSTFSPP